MLGKEINTNETVAVSMAFAVSGIGMIIGGAFLNAMAKEALILIGAAGVAVAVFALSSLLLCMLSKKRENSVSIEDILIYHLIFLAGGSIPGFCLGYGAVRIAITPLLQEAGLNLAATIGVKCAISGVLGFAFGYIGAAYIDSKDTSYKEEFCNVRNNFLCATSAGLGSIAATVLPEIIANAVGVQGDVAIAFEVLIVAAVIVVIGSAFYGAAAGCYNAYQAKQK